MRKYLLLSVALFSLVACNKDDQNSVFSKNAEANVAAADLSSLSKEQQEAVRKLVRDTLIKNPQILLEAQQAFEEQQKQQAIEMASKSFKDLTTNAAELSFGPKDAKITFIEFFDYKCGYCHAANPWVANYMKNNKDVRFIFKELPILTPNSLIAAKAAYASRLQGKYVEFHNALMTASGSLDTAQIMQIAKGVGLDTQKLQSDMQKPEVEKYLAKVQEQANQAGVTGTPGFLINGRLITGFSAEELEDATAS